MSIIKTEGIILKTFDYRESSQLLHILTPELGKLTVLGRGIKRQKRLANMGLDYFTRAHFTLFMRSPEAMALLQEVDITDTFDYLRADLAKLSLASVIAEVIGLAVSSGEPTRNLYNLCLSYLNAMKDTKSPLELTLLYLLHLIAELGFQPQLWQCINCQASKDIEFFSPARGGVVCRSCAQQITGRITALDRGLLNLLRRGIQSSTDKLGSLKMTRKQRNEVFRVIFSLIKSHISEQDLKSLRFLFQLIPELNDFRP